MFILDYIQNSIHHLFADLSKLESDTIFFVILLTISVIVVDGVLICIEKLRKNSGFEKDLKAIGIDGGKILPTKNYVSHKQQLAGKPDGVIIEDGFFIPVERKPFAKKVHERYIAQLLVYMRLVEEFEGIRPPYGYLIIGKNCKRVRIDNTEERQRWLSSLLAEMHKGLSGQKVKPNPHPKKCERCPVAADCAHKWRKDTFSQIKRTGS